MTTTPLRIDIISDVVCPWCIVGYRQLKRAAQRLLAQYTLPLALMKSACWVPNQTNEF